MGDLSGIIRSVQSAVGVEADGIAGPLTWAAISKALGATTESVATGNKSVDARSEGNIATLHEVVRPLARWLIELCLSHDINAKVISGFRTYEEQAQLYAKFKAGGAQAAPPGYSNHNFGLAFDIGIFGEQGKYIEESPLYADAGALGKSIGLIWGGDWSNSDEPHFEYRPEWASDLTESQALARYRERASEGTSIV